MLSYKKEGKKEEFKQAFLRKKTSEKNKEERR
jgi:hypothetical protein